MSFWSELKRRNVYKVGIAYLIVAWLILQVAAITFPTLNLPGWALPLLTVLIIVGFPLVLIFAWAFEITPEGLKKTHKVPHHESITHITGQKLNYIVTLLLVVAVGFMLVDNYFLDRRFEENRQSSIDGEIVEKFKTIAVLPFVDLSPEKNQQYFVDGLSEELLNSLTKIPNLLVTARTSSFLFKETDKTVQDIADLLGVAHILEGSVRKAGTSIRITAQLIRANDGFHVWSNTYDRELKDVFAVQEDIAKNVADELKVTLGIGRSFKQLGGTENIEAYEHYLVAQGQFNNGEYSQAIESIDAAITKDPLFSLAWALKAQAHNSITMDVPPNRVATELNNCVQAAQRAIELEPDLAEAYAVLGGFRGLKGEWIAAELAFQKAIELTTEPFLGVGNYDQYLLAVGHFEKANKYLEVGIRKDPLNFFTRGRYMASFGLLGDLQRAEEENQRGAELFGSDFWPDDNVFIRPFRLRLDESVSLADVFWLTGIDSNSTEHIIKSPEEALAELRKKAADEDSVLNQLMFIPICAAYLGDPDFAMDMTEKMFSLNALNTDRIWLPVMKEVRQLPKFKEFVRDIGLVDHWNKFGWPDICRPFGNGEFKCD